MSALEGASKYLNNLLLARGLLQNGKPIDFAHPNDGADKSDATMSKIINLVHDLVLRRDIEAEQHEAMTASIRTMRAEESQRILDLQRTQDKSIQLQSKANAAEASAKAMRDSVKRAESKVKELKDQVLRMKSMLDQVRAKCVSDVKTRDTEIEKLRGHISGLQRGKKEEKSRSNAIRHQVPRAGLRGQGGKQSTNATDLVLEEETIDFLTALINETSAENISLRNIISDTMERLKDMTGLDEQPEPMEEEDGIGIPGQYRKSRQKAAEAAQSGVLVPCDTLAEQISLILEHCKSILRDPSFVPVEEVQIREEEIMKLRAGWEKMADRWKEAVTMMDQWKQRMLQDGHNVDVSDWSDLSFGRSVAIRPDGQPVLGRSEDISSIFDQSLTGLKDTDEVADLDRVESTEEEQESVELDLEPAPKRIASSPAKRGVRLPRSVNPLAETDGNSCKRNIPNTRILERCSTLLTDELSSTENNTLHSKVRLNKLKAAKYLTVPEKLAIIEAEAAEAQIQPKSSSQKRKGSIRSVGLRKTSRRRSTLNPDELAALMGV